MLKDKIIVITGGAKGLGKAMAFAFSERGAKVVISDRDEQELKETAEVVKAVPILADVTKEEDLINLSEKVLSLFGTIDVWINNAGIWLPHGPIESTDMNRAHDVMEVNLFGSVYGTRAVLPIMKEKKNGIIVNIISTSALMGRPLSVIYSASKHASKGFTDSIREEIRNFNIKVIGVYPGGMKTNLFDEKKPEDFNEYMPVAEVAKRIVDNLERANPEEEQVISRKV